MPKSASRTRDLRAKSSASAHFEAKKLAKLEAIHSKLMFLTTTAWQNLKKSAL
jgi:hypothetical protein